MERVNEALTDKELEVVRLCTRRGRPFGEAEWVTETANRLDHQSTLRPRGRPKTITDSEEDE